MSQPTLQRNRQGVDYGDETNVRNLHAAIGREKREPRVTIKPFSLWVLVVWGVAFFLAGFWSTRYGAHFASTSGNPPAPQPTLEAVQTGTTSASTAATPASAVQSTTANANAPVVVHVEMKNMKFIPATIEVKSGDTVEWTNDDITPHTASAIPLFDSGSIASGQSWRHTFTKAGNFPYGCTFHPDMKGTVIVK